MLGKDRVSDGAPPVVEHSISAWRDYDDTVVALRDSMSLGSWALTVGSRISADDLFAAGVRQVTFREVIDTGSADADGTVRALTLIRDLTGCGIVVDWKLRAGVGFDDWRVLSHLYPPASVTFDGVARDDGNADPQADWANGYYLTKCAARRGPGLLQIRDRRWGGLRTITIAGPEYLAVIAELECGAPADQVPAKILGGLSAERLIGFAGGLAWWLPYRVRRWPVARRPL